MTKNEAYDEMCAELKKGKTLWSFDEIVDVVNRNMGIPKDDVMLFLEDMKEKGKLNVKEDD